MMATGTGGHAEALDEGGFAERIERGVGVAVVDFGAAWCPPCRVLEPVIDSLAQGLEGRALVGTVDVDAARGVAEKYAISAIPTVVVFRDGVEVERLTGLRPRESYERAVEKALNGGA